MIRTLKPREIEVRVQIVKETGCSLLLYKDARVDMSILDETFGALNWKREHTRDNTNCIVSVWDDDKKMWISKEDTGKENFAEKEKSIASDSFKRACFNWGIGRELYTAPFIWITLQPNEVNSKQNKINIKTKFKVAEIDYNEFREVFKLVIKDDKGKVRYTLNNNNQDISDISDITNITDIPQEKTIEIENTKQQTNSINCIECNVEIKQAVATYSQQYYKKTLCMNCQKKYKK